MVDFLLYLQYNCIYAKLELKIYSKEHQPMNSNFEYYKVFYYVSKYENLTKAASALKTSQPLQEPFRILKMNWDAVCLPEARPV